MKELRCEICGGTDSRVVHHEEIIKVRGTDVGVDTDVRVCACGNELFDEVLEEENLTKAYNAYREMQDIIRPEEIREMRESYGISQRALSRILGWGEITLHRYESGAVPDQSHSTMLELLKNPSVMKQLVMRGKQKLPKSAYESTMNRIQELMERRSTRESLQLLEGEFYMGPGDLYSGFRQFDLVKFTNALLFFAHSVKTLYKTKLNKLMFYADFTQFGRSTNSITGSRYLKFQFGPVPEKYDGLIWELEQLGLISVAVEPAGLYAGYVIRPLAECDSTVFTEDELAVLEEVAEKYGGRTSGGISELSHQENGWIETDPKSPIPYSYASALKA